MSNPTTIEKIKAIIEERKRKAREDQAAIVEKAREDAAELIRSKQKEADVLINNTTFQYIFFVHDNIIHRVTPTGEITPFVPKTFDATLTKKYKEDVIIYNKAIKEWKPTISHVVEITEEIENAFIEVGNAIAGAFASIGGSKKKTRTKSVIKTIPNPKPKPKRPTMPKSRTKRLNSAVSDIIYDLGTDAIYWGRWAAPFKVFKMSLQTNDVEELYSCDKPVTSVALGPKVAVGSETTRKIYWMEGNEWIKSGNLAKTVGSRQRDGSMKGANFLNITAPDRGGLWQLEIDAINNRLYWTNDISIWRADMVDNPEETSLMVISPSESPFPIDLAVDGYNGYLYWIDNDMKKLRRSDLEGVVIEDLYDINKPTRGIKVDPNANLLYWSDEMEDGHSLRRGDTQVEVVRLDGKDDYVEIPSISPGTSFTVEMWINPDKIDNKQCFIGKHDSRGDNLFVLGYYSNGLNVTLKNHSQIFTTEKVKGHHHLAIVVRKSGNKSSVTVYRNGKKLGNKSFNASMTNWGNRPWFIGMDMDQLDQTDFFDGGFSELRIWSSARTEAQIKSNIYSKLQGDENGLMGLWRASETQGVLIPDLTINGNYGTIITANKKPNKNNSLRFNGKTNSIVVPPFHQKFEDGISFETWVKYEKITSWARIIDFGNGPDTDNIIIANSGTSNKLGIHIRGGEDGKDLHTFEHPAIELNKWMHFAFTLDPNGKVHMYKNGKLLKSSEEGSEVHLPREVERRHNLIGKSNFENIDELFNGNILELRIWNRPLTEEEILSRLHIQLSGSEEGLVGYWPLNEGSGELIHDRTSRALHGKIFNPKKAIKEQIIEMEQSIKVLDQKINNVNPRIKELEQLLAPKASAKAIIKNNDALKRTITQEKKVLQQKIKEAKRLLSNERKTLSRLAVEARNLDQKLAQTEKIDALLKVQRSTLAAQNVFGINTDKIRALNAQISKNAADQRRLQSQINANVRNRKSIDARIKKIEKSISKDAQQEQQLSQKFNALTNANAIQKKLIQDIESSNSHKKMSEFKAQLSQLKAEKKAIESRLKPLKIEFSENVEKLWHSDFSPNNYVAEKDFEEETVVEIPGLDGLELVHAEEYLKAKRKKAVNELHRVREKGAREKAQAEAKANAKIKEGQRIKEQKEQAASQEISKAKNEASRKRAKAKSDKKTAEQSAASTKTNARKNKNDSIRKANTGAKQQKEKAQADANTKVQSARNRKRTAQSEVDRARDEKSRLT